MIKPILFNTEMARAILEDRKTVTRRVVKPQPVERPTLKMCPDDVWRLEWWDLNTFHTMNVPICIGDILYVRETWNTLIGDYIFRADQKLGFKNPGKWRPSIHMPRAAARIFLRVTDVRVERLQDITEAEAVKEGFEAFPCDHPCGYPCADCMNSGYLEPAMLGFVETWNSTIKPSDRAPYGWDANPWVWVIAFERISKEEAKNDV